MDDTDTIRAITGSLSGFHYNERSELMGVALATSDKNRFNKKGVL